MEKSSRRSYIKGKYTHVNCRECKILSSGNNECENITHYTDERRFSQTQSGSKLKYEDNDLNTSEEMRNVSEYGNENTLKPLYSNDVQECGKDYCLNCVNGSCDAREVSSRYDAAKSWNHRRLRTRRRSGSSAVKQNEEKFLFRSTSCGNVNYGDCKGNEMMYGGSSSTESDRSDVYQSVLMNGACMNCHSDVESLDRYKNIASMPNLLTDISQNDSKTDIIRNGGNNQLGLEVMLSLINGPMQSVIDSKDEKIRSLERVVECLECENKQIKIGQQPQDMTKIFTLEKTLENCIRQMEQLKEENKTAQEKARLLEDLRKNDKECIDILRSQTNDLETKLKKSDERVRDIEKEGKNQTQWLKQQYEKQIEELQKVLRAKENKLRDMDKIKSRVLKQKQDLEEKRNSENELHTKMCEQVVELKRDLQLQQTRLNILEREKRSLEESLSQSENLQRQDQKSSYVLQMKIVELQEKLDLSDRKNEELDKQGEINQAKIQVLEEKLKRWTRRRGETVSKEEFDDLAEKTNTLYYDSILNTERSYKTLNANAENAVDESKTFINHTVDIGMNELLREKVCELQKKLYMKERETSYPSTGSNNVLTEDHVEDLNITGVQWQEEKESVENVPVKDTSSRKTHLVMTGDKRRPSSSEDTSSTTSSASSSRRGSAESPRPERRQLKVLKVRRVSKENISHFQQNTAQMTSMTRQTSLKDLRESGNDLKNDRITIASSRFTAFKPIKERGLKI